MWNCRLFSGMYFLPEGTCLRMVGLTLALIGAKEGMGRETGTYYQISQTQVELLSLFRVHERLPSFS